jgi:exosortase/archaeosortase family protein
MYFNDYKRALLILSSFILVYLFHYLAIAIFAEGGFYWEYGATNFNYIKWFRSLQLNSASFILNQFGYSTYFKNITTLALENGSGIVLVYGCLGIDVISLWTIYIIFSDEGTYKRKLTWITSGSVFITFLNILRITFLLISFNKKWISESFDHHTFYNVILYFIVIGLILFHQRYSNRTY